MLNLPGKLFLTFAGLVLLSACNLPQGSAASGTILKGANAPESTFAVEPVTRETLPRLVEWPRNEGPRTQGWIKQTRGPSGKIIAAGDVIDIAVWDNEDSSLLTQPQQKVVALKGMSVSQGGTIFLPYVDEVYVAKMSPDQARSAIQQKFAAIIPSAQVQLELISGRQNSVDLVSGVAQPGNFVMPDRDFSVMSLIAMGGGIQSSLLNPQVRLIRDGKLYGVSREKLLATPSLDTTLRGGDKVYIEADTRYFLSLGAAGKEAQFPFPTEAVTALDAMSIIGGVNDSRGDPKGILILRDYNDKAVRTDGSGPSRDRVIFTLDLTTADGLFSAGEFQIQDKDLVLISESPVVAADTVIGIMFGALGLGVRASDINP